MWGGLIAPAFSRPGKFSGRLTQRGLWAVDGSSEPGEPRRRRQGCHMPRASKFRTSCASWYRSSPGSGLDVEVGGVGVGAAVWPPLVAVSPAPLSPLPDDELDVSSVGPSGEDGCETITGGAAGGLPVECSSGLVDAWCHTTTHRATSVSAQRAPARIFGHKPTQESGEPGRDCAPAVPVERLVGTVAHVSTRRATEPPQP